MGGPTRYGVSLPILDTEGTTYHPGIYVETTAAPEEPPEAVFFTRTFWYSVILVVVNITALLLNGFVVFIVARYRDMRKNTVAMCFANLAITDFMLVFFSMSGSLRRTTGIDILSVTGCVLPVYFHAASVVCTGLTMSFLAYDRYQIISDPLAALKSRSMTKLLLTFLAIWIASFAIYAFLPIITVDLGRYCAIIYRNVEKGTGDRIYHTFKAMANYFIPISVSGYFYAKIYFSLKTDTVLNKAGDAAATRANNRQKQRLRGALVASLVLLLFALCFLPTTIMSLWRAWDDNFPDSEYFKYHGITGLISRINVIGNPFLYSLSGETFKSKIKRMFSCCVRDKKKTKLARSEASQSNQDNTSRVSSSSTKDTVDFKQ